MIIGLSGKAGSGKSTVANFLVANHGFTELSFATPLKNLCSNIWKVPLYAFHDPTLKTKEIQVPGLGATTPRFMMTHLGDILREEDPNIFVWLLSRKLLGVPRRIVVSDVRYLNELNMLRQAGGAVIRIVGPTGDTGLHSSETELDDYQLWDYLLRNTGTLKQLEEETAIMVKECTWKKLKAEDQL